MMTLVRSSQDGLLRPSEPKGDASLLSGVPLDLWQLSDGCLSLLATKVKLTADLLGYSQGSFG